MRASALPRTSSGRSSRARLGGDRAPRLTQDGGVRSLRLTAALLAVLLFAGCRRDPLPDPIDLVLAEALTAEPYAFSAQRGEVVVVFFFATWCVLCQAMEPSIAEAAHRGRAEGVEVVAVALDLEGRRIVAPYVAASRPPYPVLLGGPRVASGRSPLGHVPRLPAVLILDPAGRPAWSFSGLADADFILDRAREVRGRGP